MGRGGRVGGRGGGEISSPPAVDAQELKVRFLFPVHFLRLCFSAFCCSLFPLSQCLFVLLPIHPHFFHNLLQPVPYLKSECDHLHYILMKQLQMQAFHQYGDEQGNEEED